MKVLTTEAVLKPLLNEVVYHCCLPDRKRYPSMIDVWSIEKKRTGKIFVANFDAVALKAEERWLESGRRGV